MFPHISATGFRGAQDEITLTHITTMATALSSDNNVDPQFIMGCNPTWISTKGAYIYQGHRMHGDGVPSWWADDLTNPGTVLTRPWNCLNAWGVVWVGADNTTTNAFTSYYDVQLYVLSISTGQWIRVDSLNGLPAYAFSYYELATYALSSTGAFTHDPVTSRRGWSNVPLAADRSASSASTTKYRIAHNALIPMIEVDGADVGGIFVTFKAKLFTSDGAAFNGVTKLYAQAGSDIKPELTSALNTGELAGATYYVGAGGGNLVELPTDGSSVRVSFCTVGGSGFSANVTETLNSAYGAAGNNQYLSYAEISSNLPILTFNAAV